MANGPPAPVETRAADDRILAQNEVRGAADRTEAETEAVADGALSDSLRPTDTPAAFHTLKFVSAKAAATSGTVAREYEKVTEIGRGNMGIVYKALEKNSGRIVALKIIIQGIDADKTEDFQRFRNECQALRELKNTRNIVEILDEGIMDGAPFVALELLTCTLKQKLEKERFTSQATAGLLRQLAEAIHGAHQRSILHRDLKPANILFSADGIPKIGDFGLAKLCDAGWSLTETGALMGTPSYMAPEQAAGLNKEVGPGTDIYSLGAILYEILTGRPPFQAQTALATMEQVRSAPLIAPHVLRPGIDSSLERICLKCLEKKVCDRYASAQELADDLERVLHGLSPQARPVGSMKRLGRWCREKPLRVASAVLGAAVMLALSGLVAMSAVNNAHRDRLFREQAEHICKLETEIQLETLLREDKYAEAHGLVKARRATLPNGGLELHQEILAKWRKKVHAHLANKDPVRARTEAEALLSLVENDRETGELRKKAIHGIVSGELQGLFLEEKHDEALRLVRIKANDLPELGRDLERMVRDDWLAKAERRLKEGQFKAADDCVAAILKAFPDDANALKLTRQVEQARLSSQVADRIGQADFLGACKLIEAAGKFELKAQVLEQADAASRNQRFDEALKIIEAFLSVFRDDADGQRRRAHYKLERGKVLEARAEKLRKEALQISRTADLLQPYDPQNAEATYRLLKEENALLKEAGQLPSSSTRLYLALAARCKPQPDDALFHELAEHLLGEGTEKLGFDLYVLLLAQAQAHDETPAGRSKGLRSYTELLKLAKADVAKAQTSEAIYRLYKLLKMVGARLEPHADRRMLLGRCHGDLGDVLRYYDLGWPIETVWRKALGHYTEAAATDPTNAEYLIGKCKCSRELPNPDWHAIAADARRAVKMTPKDSAANHHLAYSLLMHSRHPRVPVPKRIEFLTEAIDAFGKDDSPTKVNNRAMASHELGKLLIDTDRVAADKRFQDACRDLKMAIAQFGEAIARQPKDAEPWIRRAHLRYLLADVGQGGIAAIQEALKNLKADIEENPPDSARPEIESLQRKVYQDVAERARSLLEHAKGLKKQKPNDVEGRQCLTEARDYARLLDDPQAAADIIGKAFLLEERAKDAIETFSKGLPADRAQMDARHVTLLLWRTEIYLRPECTDVRPSEQDLIADADRALQLAVESSQKALACWLAGITRLDVRGDWATHGRTWEQGVGKLRLATEAAPKDWRFHAHLAVRLQTLMAHKKGYREEALREITLAIKQAPPEERERLEKIRDSLETSK